MPIFLPRRSPPPSPRPRGPPSRLHILPRCTSSSSGRFVADNPPRRRECFFFSFAVTSALHVLAEDSAPPVPSSSFVRASHSEPQRDHLRGMSSSTVRVREAVREGTFLSVYFFGFISSFSGVPKGDAAFVAEGMLRTSVPAAAAAVPPGSAASCPRGPKHRAAVRVLLQYRRLPAQIREERYFGSAKCRATMEIPNSKRRMTF